MIKAQSFETTYWDKKKAHNGNNFDTYKNIWEMWSLLLITQTTSTPDLHIKAGINLGKIAFTNTCPLIFLNRLQY
mgnify:CR=1 FL=1